MAAHAQVSRLHGQLLYVIGHMRVVASKAFLCCRQALVLYQCRADIFLFVLVAGQAEILRSVSLEVILVITTMGVMTLRAGFFYRGMGKFLVIEGLGLVAVAIETQSIYVIAQQFGKIALMYGMTGCTASYCCRSMSELALHNAAIMALEAELGAGGPEHISVGRLVRIMAGKTFAFLDRGMHVFMCIESLVTLRAQLSSVFNLIEGVFPFRFVTENTIARRNGTMNILLSSHTVMAISCDAAILGGSNTAYRASVSGKA